jgi:hypothetical protein
MGNLGKGDTKYTSAKVQFHSTMVNFLIGMIDIIMENWGKSKGDLEIRLIVRSDVIANRAGTQVLRPVVDGCHSSLW